MVDASVPPPGATSGGELLGGGEDGEGEGRVGPSPPAAAWPEKGHDSASREEMQRTRSSGVVGPPAHGGGGTAASPSRTENRPRDEARRRGGLASKADKTEEHVERSITLYKILSQEVILYMLSPPKI
jgi:hypothetical protein